MRKKTIQRIAAAAAMTLVLSCNKNDAETSLAESPKALQTMQNVSLLSGSDLVWSDEFNTAGPFDTTKWIYSNRGTSAWNKYLTHLPAYASSDGSDMILRMDNATIPGDNVAYHTGSIESRNKFSFSYGMVEVRMKFTESRGAWPAFWMMPQLYPYGGWPGCGEIDVAEHFNTDNVILQNVFFNSYNTSYGANYTKNAYNTYVVLWTPTSIQFFVNGLFTTKVDRPVSYTWQTWPYDQPCYIILNQSGGAGSTQSVDRNKLPFTNRVDYVRVYQTSGYVYNSGFEYSSFLTPWKAWQPTGTATLVNNNANSGTNAISLQGTECSVEQEITGLEPNTTYILKGYGKLATSGLTASVGVKNYGGATASALFTDTAYQQKSVTFTTGASNYSASIYFYKNGTSGTVFGDDFTIEKL